MSADTTDRVSLLATFASITPEEALRHPNWTMGKKVTIDSATLMNKGLEVIEAHWLFGLPVEQVDVIIHPQSIIHSLVEFVDGSMLAQLGVPDMRVAIQYALTYPERRQSAVARLALEGIGALTFEAVDREKFPCLDLAYEAAAADAPSAPPGSSDAGVSIRAAAFQSGVTARARSHVPE